MILVDTSVWVDHLRRRNPKLVALLENEHVLCHPFIVGELACGTLANRSEILHLLRALPAARMVSHEEALAFVEERKLAGAGVGCWWSMSFFAKQTKPA